MAKELPYFKFEPGAWDSGNIQMCSHESKGVFADICALYWTRLGELPYKLAVQKICAGNAKALDSLVEHDVIKIIDGSICIDFLNEQLSEFKDTSDRNSKIAREGWEKRRKDAVEMRSHSDGNAIREEKTRVEEKREDKKTAKRDFDLPFLNDEKVQSAWIEWEQHRKEKKQKLTPSTAKKQIAWLGGRAGPEIIAIINQSITKGWTGLFELKDNNNGLNFRSNQKNASDNIPREFGSADYSKGL